MENPIDMLHSINKNEYRSDESLVTFLNPYSYIFYRKNLDLFSGFNRVFIDGAGLVQMLKIIGIKQERLSFDMTSLAPIVFKDAIKNDKRVFFVGARPEEIKQFINVIKKEFPGLTIAGFRDGYFKDKQERSGVISEINKLNPDIIVAGMGTPYQEQFLIDLRNVGWKGSGYTCGGFFHQTAKGIGYYPEFYNKYNLRWLYRMIDEPKLISRYMIDYPKSILLFFIDAIRYKCRKTP